tara:strand:+ start:126 stop:1142 length:1017 start_codon:yes stop_codon:yes gene_type:complete
MPSKGSVHVAVLFADFPNANAGWSTETMFSRSIPEAKKYLEEMSYYTLDLQFKPLNKWLRMSGIHESYSFLSFDEHLRFMREAVTLADPDFDFSEIDSVIVIAHEKADSFSWSPAFTPADSYFGISADGNVITNGVTRGVDWTGFSPYVIAHEMGHTLGLADLYEIGVPSPQQHANVGNFGIMGLIVPHAGASRYGSMDPLNGNEMLAWHRWQLGWIEDSEVFCSTSSLSSIEVVPLTENAGTRMLVVPVDSSRVIVAENRISEGYDRNLPIGGILVYSVDTRIDTGRGSIKVQGDYVGDWPNSSVFLQLGEQITVEGHEISITSKVGLNYFMEVSTP